jgi:hypothetical protein
VGGPAAQEEQLAMLWVLNQSDGRQSLLDVAERSGLPFTAISAAATRLREAGLLADSAAQRGAEPPLAGEQAVVTRTPLSRGLAATFDWYTAREDAA